MVLDFVHRRSRADWFATEADKVELFTQRFGVPLRDLPQRTFAAYDQRPRRRPGTSSTSCRSAWRASRRARTS